MAAGVAQNVSGSVTVQSSFSEAITSGVITPQNLPASISQNLSYSNSQQSGNPLTVDLVYAKSIAFASANISINLCSLSDLAGNAITFQRIRELVIQNSNSFPIYLNGGNSGGSSAPGWLASTVSNIMIPGWGANSNSGASSLSTASLYSTYWPTFRICDPVTTSVSTSLGGYYVTSVSTASSVYLNVLAGTGSATSNSFNIMIAGCTQY